MASATESIPQAKRFDLPLALSLGEAAFGAYQHPTIPHNFEPYNAEDPTISVLDRTHLSGSFYGVVEVKLLSASNLANTEIFSMFKQPNPYAVVFVQLRPLQARTQSYKLTAREHNVNPTWDASKPAMRMPVWDPQYDELVVQLYDKDPRFDDEMGSATLKLSQLVGQPEQKLTLPVTGRGSGKTSTLTISCRLYDMRQCPPVILEALTTAQYDTAPEGGQAATDMALEMLKPLGITAPPPEQVPQLKGAAPPKLPFDWPHLRSVVAGATSPATAALNGSTPLGPLAPLMFIECRKTDTQVWLHRDSVNKTVVVAFRGTEKMADWGTNLNAMQDRATCLMPAPPASPQQPRTAVGCAPDEIWVHRGFLGAYSSVRGTVLPLVDSLVSADGAPASWRVMVTGHSLGGALAQLAAYDMSYRKWEREQKRAPGPVFHSVMLYTWGSPRVGNSKFVADFNAILLDAFRITNHDDIVPSVPLPIAWFDYSHGGVGVKPGKDGAPSFFLQEVEKNIQEKIRSGQAVAAHLTDRYLLCMFEMVQARLRAAGLPPSKL